jgi:hypothetical protein
MDIFAASMASVMEPILRFGPHEKAAFLANNDHIFIMGCNGENDVPSGKLPHSY